MLSKIFAVTLLCLIAWMVGNTTLSGIRQNFDYVFASKARYHEKYNSDNLKCAGKFGIEDLGKRFRLVDGNFVGDYIGVVKDVDCTTGITSLHFTKKTNPNFLIKLERDYTLKGLWLEGDEAPMKYEEATPSPTPAVAKQTDSEALERTLKDIEAMEDTRQKAQREANELKAKLDSLERELKIRKRTREILNR